MTEPEPTLTTLIVNWLPFVLYLVVTLYIARIVHRYTTERSKADRDLIETLSRIATALEKRS